MNSSLSRRALDKSSTSSTHTANTQTNNNKSFSNTNKNRLQSVSNQSNTSNEVFSDNENEDFQLVKNKSKRILSSTSSTEKAGIKKSKPVFVSTNRYNSLYTHDIENSAETSDMPIINSNNPEAQISHSPLPPPIFICNVNDFIEFRNHLIKLIGPQNFSFKSSANNLKISTTNSDSYREVIKYLKQGKAEYHTYQAREDKAFRIVIRNLHPTTPTSEVGVAIEELGYSVRQVTNFIHKTTKRPLPIFFVDLEPAQINNEIFKLTSLLHTKITVEEPHKKKEIIQCSNCQEYGHSKSYCAHPPRCVRCADFHPTQQCTKSKDTPATCALCGDNQIDVALITETHYTNNSKHFFPGYNVYSTNHPDETSHAGSAILISSSIQHYALPCFQFPSIQVTNVSISINHIPIIISAVYCPPRPSISQLLLNQFLSSLGRTFIAGGDFNAKHLLWGSRVENPRGRIFFNSIKMNKLSVISPSCPTYWPTHQNRQPDLLDFFITSIPNHINHSIHNVCDLSSDHSPVLLNIMNPPILTSPRPSLSKGPVNWNLFSTWLANNTNLKISLKSCNEIESAAQNLVSSIQSAVYECSYPPNPNYHPKSKHNDYILPPDIKALIAEKRRTRSRWQRSRLPSDKSTLNNLTNTIKKLIQIYKNDLFDKKFKLLNTHDGSLWKTTKSFLKLKKFSSPIKKADSSLACSDLEKANLFGEYLSNIFTPHQNIIPNTAHLDKINTFIDAPLPMSIPIKHVSPNEISNIIQRLKPNKSPGHDLITNKILKHLPRKTIVLLTYIFNSMLRLSYFPTIWKLSIIILVPKPGKPPNVPTSYRPISLLPTLGKLFEKVVLKRLRPITETQKIIPNAQFGFRAKHSTIQQVHRLVDTISSSFENKKYCPGIFLDVAQAFDRVWHTGLLYKIKQFLPAPLYLLIRSFLEHRTFKVRHGNSLSSLFSIQAGVPQGSDLSPDLYNIFTSDIPSTQNTLLATYADDTSILSPNNSSEEAFNALQLHLDLIDKWSTDWKIKINADKSVLVSFTLNKKNTPIILFQGVPIPSMAQVKYLGIVLDKRLTWGPHLKSKRKSLNSRSHLLRPILKSKLPIHNKIQIYKSLLRPIWSYGAQIWGCAKPTQIKTIEAFQSISLRTITSAPWFVSNHTLHKDLKIETVENLVKTHYKKFHNKLLHHPNPLIANQHTATIPGNPPRRLKRRWCRDLLN
ncbi:hypothetical protein QTP88_027050 [Uroleucon formosanum]